MRTLFFNFSYKAALFPRWVLGLLGMYTISILPLTANLPSDALPQGFAVKRYEALWKRSPFTLESIVPELQKGFAANLMLVGTSTVGTNHYVMLVDSKSAQRFLVSESLNPNGIKLVSIERHEDPTKVTATLKKGEETSIVKFDPTALKSMPTVPKVPLSAPTVNPLGASSFPGGVSNVDNRMPIRPNFTPPEPQKFIRKRFPIPGENPEETKAEEEKKTEETQ